MIKVSALEQTSLQLTDIGRAHSTAASTFGDSRQKSLHRLCESWRGLLFALLQWNKDRRQSEIRVTLLV